MSQEMNKGLRHGGKGPMTMKNLVEVPFELETLDRNVFEEAVLNFPPDRGAGKDGNPKAGDQGFFDRLSTAQFHDHIEELFGLLSFSADKVTEGAQRPGATFTRDKALTLEIA